MTAELLKTPSPKKRSAAAMASRFPMAGRPAAATSKAPTEGTEPSPSDKENQSLVPSASSTCGVLTSGRSVNSAEAGENVKQNKDKSTNSGDQSRSTRSRANKSQLIQLPNPFEARLLQAKRSAKEKDADKARDARSVQNEHNGASATAILPDADRNTETKQKKKKHTSKGQEKHSDASSRPQEEAESNQRNYTEKSGAKAVAADKAPQANNQQQEFDLPDEASKKIVQTAPASSRQDTLADKSGVTSSAFVSAPSNAEVVRDCASSVGEGEEEEGEEEVQATRPPQESTPPPESPDKARKGSFAESAQLKLDASLLKLDNSEHAMNGEQLLLGATQEEGGDSDASVETISEEDEEEKTKRAPMPSYTTNEPDHVSNGASDGQQRSEKNDEDAPVTENLVAANSSSFAPAPKRTLSSMAHAKKSLVRSSNGTKQHNVPTATTRPSVTKGSFLSKSLAQVEPAPEERDGGAETLRLNASEGSARESSSLHTSDAPQLSQHLKRKSGAQETGTEVQTSRDAKAQKVSSRAANDEKANKGGDLHSAQRDMSQTTRVTYDDKRTRTSIQPQSLREKIESFHVQKSNQQSASVPLNAQHHATSMSTHAVGIGAKKLSSPLFSQSNSQSHFTVEPTSPSRGNGPAKPDLAAQFHDRQIQKPEADAKAKQPQMAKGSTTPVHSHGPSTRDLYPSIQQPATRIPSPAKSPFASPAHVSRLHDSGDAMLSDSEVEPYDTLSDGDLSLVDLKSAGQSNVNSVKPPATAPRPPGTQVRPATALPKNSKAGPSASKTAFMPSHGAGRDVPIASKDAGSTEHNVRATPTSGSTTVAPTTPHGTWGGSISLKLKGILGFATPNNPSTSVKQATARQPGPSSIVRKESAGAIGNIGAKAAAAPHHQSTTAMEKKQTAGAGSSRADSDRRVEANQAARKVGGERDAASKPSMADLKKRARDDAIAANASAPKSKVPAPNTSSIARPHGQKAAAPLATQNADAPDPKRRKTNEAPSGLTSNIKEGSQAASKTIKVTGPQQKPPIVPSQKPSTSTVAGAISAPVLKPQPTRPTPGQPTFSSQNPFQKAQSAQQDQALATVSKQLQYSKQQNANTHDVQSAQSSKISKSVAGSAAAVAAAAAAQIELEEPDSAYSDSEDEETIRRRMQHKPWETRDGLAQALEAQSTVDADMIFGIPQGSVPLDEILPAQTEGARTRRMRPRSSSATWSRDGLKQSEIDRYNERMGIHGPGVKLGGPDHAGGRSASSGSGVEASPNRGNRLSAIAQSAVSQGHVACKKGQGQGQGGHQPHQPQHR